MILHRTPCRPGRRRATGATLLFVATAVSLLGACARDAETVRWARGEAVGRLVAELLQQKDSVDTVNLADLAPFRWDSLYIFPPHTPARVVDSALGMQWGGAERSGIAQVDTAVLLVFTDGGDVMAATMHPVEFGDFTPSATTARTGAIPSTEAVFDVVRPGGGGRLMRRAGPPVTDNP